MSVGSSLDPRSAHRAQLASFVLINEKSVREPASTSEWEVAEGSETGEERSARQWVLERSTSPRLSQMLCLPASEREQVGVP